MNSMLIFFTALSLIAIIFGAPVWFASSIEILNKSNSKLRFIPVINEIRAELLYWGPGPILISWIALFVAIAGKLLTWWYLYGTVWFFIFHYFLWIAVAAWYLAKGIAVFRLLRDMNLTSTSINIVYSIIYPVGYYMLQAACKTYKAINGSDE